MTRIDRFEQLEAWQQARVMVREVYALARTGSLGRDYPLRNQITSAAVSVMANIAEGFDRGTDREFVRFLRIAKASACEVQSHLYVALDQQVLNQESFNRCTRSVARASTIIGGLIRYLRQSKNEAKPRSTE